MNINLENTFIILFLWLILFGLFILGITNQTFYWIAAFIYFLSLILRAIAKIENHKDWLIINKRDEELKIEEVRNDMANRGLTFSSIRQKAEEKVRQDFEFERKKGRRNIWIDILFLK